MMKTKLLLGVACFIISFMLFFPFQGVRNRIFNEVSLQTGLEIFAGKMRPTFTGLGVSMNNVTLQLPSRAADTNNIDIELEVLQAYVPWVSLLSLSPSLRIEGWIVGQGTLWMNVRLKDKDYELRVYLKQIDATSYLKKLGMNDMDISGKVTLDLLTLIDKKGSKLGKTEFNLELEKLSLSAIEMAGFNIPGLAFNAPGKIKGTAKDGSNFSVNLDLGDKVDPFILSSEGTVKLDIKKLSNTNFNLNNTIEFSEAFLKNETISMILPLLEQYNKGDGKYHVKVSGSVNKGVGIPTSF
jgi:type II secretion system protein N